jgi:hypothetical protein
MFMSQTGGKHIELNCISLTANTATTVRARIQKESIKMEYGIGHSIPFKRHWKQQSGPVAISVIAIIVAPVIAKKE